MIISLVLIIFSKNMINETVNLAFTFLVSTNVRLIKDVSYNKIIKRFSHGGKKIGEKIAEKLVEKMTESISKTSPSINIVTPTPQNPMPKYIPQNTQQKHDDNTSTQNHIENFTKKNILIKPSTKPIEKIYEESNSSDENILKNFVEKEQILLLNPPSPIKYSTKDIFVSGLASIDTKLINKPEIVIENTRCLSIFMARVLYFMFSNKHINDNPIDQIENILSKITWSLPTGDIKLFKEILASKYGPYSQHTINFVSYFIKIDKNILQQRYPFIDMISYERYIGFGLITEMYFFNKALFLQDKDKNNINFEAINHNNIILQENNNIFNSTTSLAQTGQSFSDVILYKLIIDKNFNISIVNLYKDIKSNYRGISKGHITIIPDISTNQTILNKYINDMTTYLNDKARDHPTLNKDLIDFRGKILNIKNKKNLSILEKLKEINNLIINTYCSEKGIIWVQKGINITIAGDINDVCKDNDFINYSKDADILIEKNLKNVSIKDISEFIPNTNKLNMKGTMDFLEKFIKTSIPTNFQKEIWENIHKFISQ